MWAFTLILTHSFTSLKKGIKMHFTPTKFGTASKPVSRLSKLKFTALTITVMSMYPLYYVLSVSAINLSKMTILV